MPGSPEHTANASLYFEKQNPRAIAETLVAEMKADEAFATLLETVEIAGPGFINFRVAQNARAPRKTLRVYKRQTSELAEAIECHFGATVRTVGRRYSEN